MEPTPKRQAWQPLEIRFVGDVSDLVLKKKAKKPKKPKKKGWS